MTDQLNRTQLTEALSVADLGPDAVHESYSGRGMYGRTCLAVAVDSMTDAFALFAALAHSHAEDGVEPEHTDDLARGARVDNFGQGLIVYFPGGELD